MDIQQKQPYQGGDRGRSARAGGRDQRRSFGSRPPREKSEFDSKMLDLARVARVTKGGKRFSFRATMAIGDHKGRVGIGIAQGKDVQQAMQKSTNNAKKNLVNIVISNATIPHAVTFKYHSAVVIMKPATHGSGVKAGGPVRVIAKLAGIDNVTAKLVRRTGNKINIARATIGALASLKMQAKIVVDKPSI